LPGRLFPGDDDANYDLSFLQPHTMYYADERDNGKNTHPLAEICFLTQSNDLVLINVYGGKSKKSVDEKMKKFINWILMEQCHVEKYKLQGVVLAPHTNTPSRKEYGVSIVAGTDAVKLLGGLQQIYQWLE